MGNTIVITIETGNAAFNDPDGINGRGPEVARILRDAARRIENLNFPDADEPFPLFDINGNVVGAMASGDAATALALKHLRDEKFFEKKGRSI